MMMSCDGALIRVSHCNSIGGQQETQSNVNATSSLAQANSSISGVGANDTLYLLESSLEQVYFSGYPIQSNHQPQTFYSEDYQTSPINNYEPLNAFYLLEQDPGQQAGKRDASRGGGSRRKQDLNMVRYRPTHRHFARPSKQQYLTDFRPTNRWPLTGHKSRDRVHSPNQVKKSPYKPDSYKNPSNAKSRRLENNNSVQKFIATETKPENQVLLSQKMASNDGTTGSSLDSVSLADLSALLKRLQPLDLQKDELNQGDDEEEEDEVEQDQGSNPKEEKPMAAGNPLDQLIRHQNRLERTIPESEFYERPRSSLEDTDMSSNSSHGILASSALDQVRQAPSGIQQDEDLMFLKNLVFIDQRAPGPPINDELLEVRRPQAEQSADTNRRPPEVRPMIAVKPPDDYGRVTQQQQQPEQVEKSLPVDQLVDHLMSNSRLASFGVQHADVQLPKMQNDDQENSDDADNENNGEEDEEEDNGDSEDDGVELNDDEEDDPEAESQDSDESAPISDIIPLNPTEPTGPLNFSSLINKTTGNSWIPVEPSTLKPKDELASSSKGSVQQISGEVTGEKENDNRHVKGTKKTKKKRKKKKKRKRKKKDNFGLFVGDRMLNKTEVIKLIGILSKMSNKSKATKEREASRKLLRFLIKLILNEFQKDKLRKAGKKVDDLSKKGDKKKVGGSKDPIRELLRSVLMGPVDTKKNGTVDDGSLQLRPLEEKEPPEKQVEVKSAGEEKQEDVKGGGKDANKDEPRKEETKEEQKHKKRGLGELSDELEHYFDEDFFEDMADKNKTDQSANKKIEAVGSQAAPSSEIEDREKLDSGAKKRDLKGSAKKRRASRLGYTLPVPVFGRQLTDKVDGPEDTDYDPDLDRDPESRLKGRKSEDSEPDSSGNIQNRKRPKRGRQRRRRRRRKPKVTSKRKRKDESESDQPEEEAADDSEDVEEEEEEPVKNQEDGAKQPEADHHQSESSNQVEDNEGSSSKKKSTEENDGYEEEDEEEPEEKEDDDEDAERKPKQQVSEERDKEKKASVKGSQAERKLKGKKQITGKRKPSKRKRKKRRKEPFKLIDREPKNNDINDKNHLRNERRKKAESRYEIPAPIVAGQSPVADTKQQANQPTTISKKPTNETTTSAMSDKSIGASGIVSSKTGVKSASKRSKSKVEEDSRSKVKTKVKAKEKEPKKKDRKKRRKKKKKKPDNKKDSVGKNSSKNKKSEDSDQSKLRKRASELPRSGKAARGRKRIKPSAFDPDPDELANNKAEPEESDVDYYTASSSYSKHCDDEGKECRVRSDKSSPQIKKT